MIKKFDKIEEVENQTIGITKKFAEDGTHRKTIERNKKNREEETKENED